MIPEVKSDIRRHRLLVQKGELMATKRIVRAIQNFADRALSKATIPTITYRDPLCTAIPSYGHRNSIITIDVSPSMELKDWKPSRLDAALEAAKTFVARLREEEPSASVGIITYHRSAEIIVKPMKGGDYLHIQNAIDSIRTGPATSLGAGLKAALSLVRSRWGANQVILLSDGRNNCGPDPRPIADRLKKLAVIECVGIGGSRDDVDEDLLRHIASSRPDGSKRYRWIGDEKALVEQFHSFAGRLGRS